MRRVAIISAVFAAAAAGGCGGEEASPEAPTATTVAPDAALPDTTGGVFTTMPGADGTRYAPGMGRITEVTPIDVELPGVPEWVVGVPLDGRTVWWVALDSGEVVEVTAAGAITGVATIQPGAPPTVAVGADGVPSIAVPLRPGAAEPATPLLVNGTAAWIGDTGDLIVEASGTATALAVSAPPDARTVATGNRFLVVGAATERYPHGALGDSIEASALFIVSADQLRAERIVELDAPSVFEGTTPMWIDLDGDGDREIVLTVSDPQNGARLVAFSEDGAVAAEGPPIGRGNRWRHQVAAASFGPDGTTEIAAVLTPHIGGTVEFYRMVGDRLEIVAGVPGYSSHRFRSPNLDMGLAADANGDGRVELVVPSDDLSSLAGIQRIGRGAEVSWRLPTGGLVVTNIGVASQGGRLAFAVGTNEGFLRVWPA